MEYRYETPYWPGVEDIESARIFELASGSRVNVGTLAVRAVPHYNVRVSVRGADCQQDSPITARLSRILRGRTQYVGAKQVACGQDFGLRVLHPGSYQLEIFSRPEAIESRKRARLFFDVTDHNQSLEAVLTSGTNLNGAFLAPEGFHDFEKLSVSVVAIDTFPLNPLLPAKVDANGAFVISNVPQGLIYLQIQGTPQGSYVRRVRYNNRELDGHVMFPFVWGGSSLTVEIDDQPAALSGTIRRSDGNPAEAAAIVLARWPLNTADQSISVIRASANEAGTFQATGLHDAEYRVFAYASDDAALLDEPGRLERVLTNAKRVSLKRGETQTLDLTLTDISR